MKRHLPSVRVAGALCLLAFLRANAAGEPVVLFRQPTLDRIDGKLYVQARIPESEMCLISWQRNPWTTNGSFVPVSWSVGEKTGLEIAADLPERQAGMADRQGVTAAQVCGTAVGAYLNSDDLSGDGLDAAGNPLPGSPGYKMMITPEIRFPLKPPIKPFANSQNRLLLSFDLQVPVAKDEKRAGSHSYVNPCFVFIDPNTRLKISYIIVTFSNGYRIVKESIAYDEPSHSWMLHTYMSTHQHWMALEPGSEGFQSVPWKGWKHFALAITPATVRSALQMFARQKPGISCSGDPADYVLQSFHLNAELKFQTAHAELGWSMRNAVITLE